MGECMGLLLIETVAVENLHNLALFDQAGKTTGSRSQFLREGLEGHFYQPVEVQFGRKLLPLLIEAQLVAKQGVFREQAPLVEAGADNAA